MAFLCAAVDKGTDLDTFSDIHKSDTFRSVDLVSACAQHIDIHRLNIDRHMAESLYCICVEQYAVFFRDLSDLRDRLDRSDLIIGKHNRD